MDLIKLSTILYPSLPGPSPRRIELPADPIEPRFFDEASANRVEVMAYITTIIGVLYGGWMLAKWAGIF